MYYLIIIAIVLILDRIVKLMIISNMDPNATIPVIENFFHITFVRNTGAAFSILQDKQLFLICINSAIMLLVAIFFFIKRKKLDRIIGTGMALIIGGGVGNIIDRVMYGYVVDFMDFRIWPVFNIADMSIVCGCLIVMAYILFFEGRKNKNSDEIDESGSDENDSGSKK